MPTGFLWFSAGKTHQAIQQDGNVYNDYGAEPRRAAAAPNEAAAKPLMNNEACLRHMMHVPSERMMIGYPL